MVIYEQISCSVKYDRHRAARTTMYHRLTDTEQTMFSWPVSMDNWGPDRAYLTRYSTLIWRNLLYPSNLQLIIASYESLLRMHNNLYELLPWQFQSSEFSCGNSPIVYRKLVLLATPSISTCVFANPLTPWGTNLSHYIYIDILIL